MERRNAARIAAGIMAASAAVGALAQSYPSRPLRIVSSEPGGGNDFGARVIAQALTGALGQQVIVENRAGGAVAIEYAARAQPDGYTLLMYSNGLWTLPFIQHVRYDALTDFVPITLAVRGANVLVVHPSVPVKSVKELIALAKSKPGELNYASGSTGSSPHIAGEMFKTMAGLDIVRVNYKGSGPAVAALVGGQVQFMFATTGAASPHMKSGRLRGLAVTTAEPSALAPGLPTVASAGLSGYAADTPYGVYAPARTPAGIVTRLNQEIVKLLARPEIKERFFNAGVEVVGSTPEQFAAVMKTDIVRVAKLVKDAGIVRQ
jgi:tripartite-type tricarboxylate transporter receptor subunit TctC